MPSRFLQQEAHVSTAVPSPEFCSEIKGDQMTRIISVGDTTDTCLGLILKENHYKDGNH